MALKFLHLVVVFLLSLSFVIKSPAADALVFDSKSYLQRYGYFEYAQLNLEAGASEEQILELAMKTYQGNFGIKPSGILDDETLSAMMVARCGNRDITGGVNSMKPRNRNPAVEPIVGVEL
ncbi:neutrophil collagenase [Salvia divinorum]|uniref:Neutrophil collagenase n=1 Tax=Salvia divinorum TaxID=28513 RepID=A0ABD1GRR1_SALDI